MKVRYSFLKTPLDGPIPTPPNEGYKFENGVFNGKNGAVQIVSMTSHGDGIVIDTRSSTDDADLFLEDVISWASKEYNLPALSDLPVKRIYASELNVFFKRAPAIFNPKLAPFLKEASSIIGNEKKGKSDLLGFQLSTDYALSDRPAQFRFEREINVPYEENRYYSFAPTTTDAHIKLLEKLGKLAT